MSRFSREPISSTAPAIGGTPTSVPVSKNYINNPTGNAFTAQIDATNTPINRNVFTAGGRIRAVGSNQQIKSIDPITGMIVFAGIIGSLYIISK